MRNFFCGCLIILVGMSAHATVPLLGYSTTLVESGVERKVFAGIYMKNLRPEAIRLDIVPPRHAAAIEQCTRASSSAAPLAAEVHIEFEPQYESDVRVFDLRRIPAQLPDKVILRSVQCVKVGKPFRLIWERGVAQLKNLNQ